MKAKRKNLSKLVPFEAEEDFPSLHPGKAALEVQAWDKKQEKSDIDMESTWGSLNEFPALVSTQKKAQNDTPSQNAPQSPIEITQIGQNLNSSGQFFGSPMMFDWTQGPMYYNPMYFQQMMEPVPKKALEPMLVRKMPLISRRKQVFTWIEPKSSQKVEQKQKKPEEPVVQPFSISAPEQNLQRPSQILPQPTTKLNQPQTQSLKSQPLIKKQKPKPVNQDQRPLDKFALQVINRYKKQLRKQSSDTTVSDLEEPKSQQEQNQFDMLEEIEKNHTILEFRLGNVFQKVIRGKFQRAFRQPYSTHYQYLKAKKYIPPVDKVKQIQWITQGHLRILNINLDLNIASRGFQYQNQDLPEDRFNFFRKTKVYYGNVTDQQRAQQFIQIIKQAMSKGVDFILLQQAYQSQIRSLLLNLINQLSTYQFGKYFYPDNIQNFQYSRTTLILSKHPVRFGQMQFEILEYDQQKPNKFYFPLQAFCEFEILIDKKVERIGILNCHLRSNGERNSEIPPWRMRQKQLDCIHDWGKRQNYDRFFVIGDTNMPSGEKFKSENIETDAKFFDAFDQGFTPIGGTYLYKNERNQVVEQRMDRVLMNKQCSQNTVVEIQYEDVLLKSCEGKKLDKKKMLEKYENQLTYVTLSDHKMMDITIYMTQRK